MQPNMTEKFVPGTSRRRRTARTLLLRMAADQERADRIRALKADRPDLKWQYIADRVGVTMRAAQSWQEKGEISYANAKRLAELFEIDVDYIWRGEPATPDLFGSDSIEARLDRIEIAVTQLADAVRQQRIENGKHLEDQTAVLELIKGILGIGGEEPTIQERLVGMFRDAQAQAAGPSGPTGQS